MALLSDYLRHDVPLSTGATAVYPYSVKLDRKYRFTSRFDDEVSLCYREGEDLIHLPRALCPVGTKDMRNAGIDVVFPKGPTPRDNQTRIFNETADFLEKGLSGLVSAYTGWGKCLAPHEPVLMFDGSIKRTDALRSGDLLMGPDSTSREVISTNWGQGSMYRVTPDEGEPFECNGYHILSLKCVRDCEYGKVDDIVNVPLREWLYWSDEKKDVYNLWRVGVEFPESKLDTAPYDMGISLDNIWVLPHRTPTSSLIYITEREHVPSAYLVASRQQRLELLAGLIDGGAQWKANGYRLITWNPRLASNLVFLVRSLGLGVDICDYPESGRTMFEVYIHGDFESVPIRFFTKNPSPRRYDPLRTSFSVSSLGIDSWFGIRLSGDRLYLTGDFMVTHNTMLGYHAAFSTQKKTLVITTKADIFKQWINGAPKALGIDSSKVGAIRGDKCQVKDASFCVAMIHSLAKKDRYPEWIRDDFGLVIFDEVHRLPADFFMAVATMFPARLRLGLSATMARSDGKELLVYAHIGPVRAKTEGELLVPKVLRFRTSWECPRVLRQGGVTGERKYVPIHHEPGRTAHIEKMIAADSVRNHLMCDTFNMVYKKGRKLVVFSTLLSHLETLKRATIELGVPGSDVGMYVGASKKSDIEYRDKIKGRPILFATFSMMSEGTDIPWLDTCALAMPRSRIIQPVGRIRREYEGKGDPVVLDFVDNSSSVFAGYARNRLYWYKSLGCEVVEMN